MRAAVAVSLVLAVLVPAAGAVSAATRQVRLSDTAIAPARIDIAAGDSVRWLNTGKLPHRVASSSNAWTAFVVRPGAGKSIRFAAPGCHPYKVDGRRSGLVAVSSPCGGGGGGTSTPGQAVYRYDVTVEGRAHTVQRHSGDTGTLNNANGTVDLELAWKSTFRNASVKKVAVANTFVIVNTGGLFAAGATAVKFTYKHARETSYGPCQGTFSFPALASRLRVAGSRTSSGAEFTVGSQVVAAATLFNKMVGTQKAACKDYYDEPRWLEFQGAPEPDVVRGGLTWGDVDPISTLTVSVERKAPRIFFPLDKLQSGRGFVIQTGPLKNEGPCHFGVLAPTCTERFEGFLRITFTPRRP
jgi:plastocyanin